MSKRNASLALIALLSAAPVHAQASQPDPLLEHLVGTWVLRGTIAGQQVVHDVTCKWVLGAEYVEIREVSREKAPNGSPEYEAIVYVGSDPKTHRYSILWLDNTAFGAFAPAGTGHAMAAGDSIPFVFGGPPTDRILNTFVYKRATNTWVWHIDNEAASGRREFARVTLSRR
jgi:hypothetical protein